MNYYLLFLFLITIPFSSSYILPQTFREFHPIGIYSNINKHKPSQFNIGSLPLLLWFPHNNKPITIINVCKHLGNNLKDSSLINNKTCLSCPFHNTIYNYSDNFGTTIIKNGIVWWSYKSYTNNPPYLKKNIKYMQKTIDINVNIISLVLNFIAIFFNNNYNKYYINFNKKRFFIKNYNKSKRILFIYPYTFFISDYKNPSYMITLFPVNDNKTKMYIVIDYNINSYFLNNYLYMYIKNYLEKTNNNFKFKHLFIFKSENKNKYLKDIYKLYNNYNSLNDDNIKHFINNYKFY
jgi:phenylpropionate dioxygenase-like ring-hydroxylating dioxygenase large terminal subunit